MTKKFNITGTCISRRHYMVNIDNKLSEIRKMIDEGEYFTINRPRQYGKTTILYHLEKKLTATDYFVLSISFEGIGDVPFENELQFSGTFINLILREISFQKEKITTSFTDQLKKAENLEELSVFITKFNSTINKKVVLIIDEVDKSSNNQLFLSFIGMLREKYLRRNVGKDCTFHSVILAGVHDVKTLKVKLHPREEQKYNSPWNIAVDFDVDLSFCPEEIETMLVDYAMDKKVEMDTSLISRRIYHYTNGHPFLVSRVCKEVDEKITGNRIDKNWCSEDIDNAVKVITSEKNTNFESLIKHIEEYKDIGDIVKDIVLANKQYRYNALNSAIDIGETHGIFVKENNKVCISNKIYEEVITDYITSKLESATDFVKDIVQSSYIKSDNRLNFTKVLLKFQEVIKEKYSKSDLLKSDEFLEKDLRLLFLVFLKPIINGIGFSFKEVETSEEKRLDIIVIFRDEKFIVELKVWRGQKYHKQGIERLKDYMRREGIDKGYMLIMDKKRSKTFTRYQEEDIMMVWI